MDINKWKSQLHKGTSEFAVLLVLENNELYGLEILNLLTDSKGLTIAEGTIYPLLNRLNREGKIESNWIEDGPSNHPRKYYNLTKEGQQFLLEMKSYWNEFQQNLNSLNEGVLQNENK